jgi:TRAP-type C4-dicarboxylate transport system permease small subunit
MAGADRHYLHGDFTFIGAAVGYRAGSHIAVNMLTDRLPDTLKDPLRAAWSIC